MPRLQRKSFATPDQVQVSHWRAADLRAAARVTVCADSQYRSDAARGAPREGMTQPTTAKDR